LEKTGTPAGVSGCSGFPCDLGLAIALVKAFPVRFWFSLAMLVTCARDLQVSVPISPILYQGWLGIEEPQVDGKLALYPNEALDRLPTDNVDQSR
jgi:hypothetical protein